jgi:transcriptional regulator of acetoin/glycerol metabolism
MQRLRQYSWPGNIRELENAIERAVVLSSSRTLEASDFPFLKPSAAPVAKSQKLRDMEIFHILKVLDENDWNITRSSAILGINRVTLHKKIKRLGLQKTPSIA